MSGHFDTSNNNSPNTSSKNVLLNTRSLSRSHNFEWFIKHRAGLGSTQVTPKIVYSIVIVVTIVFTIIEQQFKYPVDSSTSDACASANKTNSVVSVTHVQLWSVSYLTIFFIVPMMILGYLYYEIRFKLKLEDTYFVGLELKYQFWLVICNQCIFFFAEYVRLHIHSTNSKIDYIFFGVAYFLGTLSYVITIVFLTKWVLDKLQPLLLRFDSKKQRNLPHLTSNRKCLCFKLNNNNRKAKKKKKPTNQKKTKKKTTNRLRHIKKNTKYITIIYDIEQDQGC